MNLLRPSFIFTSSLNANLIQRLRSFKVMKVENLTELPSLSIFIKIAPITNLLALRHLKKMGKLRGNIQVLPKWALHCYNMPSYQTDSGLTFSQLLSFSSTSCPHQPWIWIVHILNFKGNILILVCFTPLVQGASLTLEIIGNTSWNPSPFPVYSLGTTLNIKDTTVSAPQLVMFIPPGMW